MATSRLPWHPAQYLTERPPALHCQVWFYGCMAYQQSAASRAATSPLLCPMHDTVVVVDGVHGVVVGHEQVALQQALERHRLPMRGSKPSCERVREFEGGNSLWSSSSRAAPSADK